MLIVEKEIVKYSYEDTDFSTITCFYSEEKNKDKICLFYSDDELKTLFSYEDFYKWERETEYVYYLRTSNNNRSGYEIDEAGKIFEKFPSWQYLIVELGVDRGNFICSRLTSEREIINSIFKTLSKKGIHVYRINIPLPEDIVEENRADYVCKNAMGNYLRLIQEHAVNPPEYIQKITDVPEQDLRPSKNLHGKIIGEHRKTIFLVGPCIIGGWGNPDGERLGEILYEKIQKAGMDYQIRLVAMNENTKSNKKEMLENDVKKNDIVMIVTDIASDYELDLTPKYNSYKGSKFLYTDLPIHTTVTANKLIADELIEKVIKPVYDTTDKSEDEVVLYHGRVQFSPQQENEIFEFTKNIKRIRDIPADATVGAIVMNCNPFTYGHRYLVEYAAAKVDYLYLFVVEEDLSAVPFVDRLFLVREGIKDISNVIVIPSGKFIISKDTFFNYFDKENDTHVANAEEDVEIFGRFIAQKLRISKRFVGEEPYDEVTGLYNSTLKEILPFYGVELVEIPRKKYEGEDYAINATNVRMALKKGDFGTISKTVPSFVVDYLCENKNTVVHRMYRLKEKEGMRACNIIQEKLDKLVKEISSFDKVVLYSIGIDTQGIVKRLPIDVFSRIEYCDKSANNKTVYFNNKKVHSPKELMTSLKDYTIVVGTSGYGKQVYEEFAQDGIELSRCIFNTISFFGDK